MLDYKQEMKGSLSSTIRHSSWIVCIDAGNMKNHFSKKGCDIMRRTGKKMVAFLVCLVLFMGAALGGYSFTAEAATKKEAKQSAKQSKEKKVLVVYFSRTGTTKTVAKKIKKMTGGTMFRIQTKKKYPSNYDKMLNTAQKEQDEKARPALKKKVKSMKKYDVIVIGYPIWWHTTPRVVNTFLEKYNLKGKTVIPFCTSGGSEIDESLPALRKSAKGAVLKEGYTADSGSTAEIKRWLTRIGELGNNSNPSTPQNPVPDSSNGKLLVAYFSWSGTSEKIAQNIIAQTGADSFRIERETPYSTDYNTVAYGEAQTEAQTNARPPIKNPPASVAQYDKIVLCYPIWWHTAPMTVGTFLERYDLTGKTVYPVSQSASMDRSQYEESLPLSGDVRKVRR